MPLSIPTPKTSNSKQNITLNGVAYDFILSFNEKDSRWRLSIYLGDVPVILGVKLVENMKLFSRYILPDFNHGNLVCVKRKSTTKPLGRDNLGIGQEYELIYVRNEDST
jgi:hypothetical protein